MGHDLLSFVPESLPFNITGSDPYTATYTQNRHVNELRLGYVKKSGSADYLTVSPRLRNSARDVYSISGVKIVDTSGAETIVDIEIRVINSLPRLVNPDRVLYLTTNFNGSSSTNNSSEEAYPGPGEIPDSGTTITGTGYNIREFVINEMVTDPDSLDISSLEIISQPVIGTLNSSGEFVEMEDGKDYITVDYNIMGTGNRSNYIVTRITAKSSTQALASGLFVRIEVTDKFNKSYFDYVHNDKTKPSLDEVNLSANTTYLVFQVEVLNSDPVLSTNGQFDKLEGTDTGYGWNMQPVNLTEILAPRYIAPDAETAAMLTDTGYLASEDGVSESRVRVLPDNVRYFLDDYDLRQHLMPNVTDSALLPTTQLISDPTTPFRDNAAVKFSNPYGTIGADDPRALNTVKFIWFVKDGSDEYHLVDLETMLADETATSIDPYATLKVPFTAEAEPDLLSLAECLEKDLLYWAIKIAPAAEFQSDGIDITVSYRDSTPEGGCTQTVRNDSVVVPRELAYKGNRNSNGERVEINSRGSVTFTLKIGSLGMTRNTVAYSTPNDEANNNRYYEYYEKKTGADTEYEAVYPDGVKSEAKRS